MRARAINALSVVALGLLVWPARTGYALKAVPHQPAKVYAPSSTLAKPRKPTRYERVWAKYQACIGTIEKEREQIASHYYDSWYEQGGQVDARASHGGKQILDELRVRASKHHGLSFDGEVPESKYFAVTSDASARVFATLLQEGVMDSKTVISKLNGSPIVPSDAWLAMAKDIIGKLEPGSTDWKLTAQTLYRAGMDRDKYRPVLEQSARSGNSLALMDLLYDLDKRTGVRVACKSAENTALMKELAGKNPRPGIMVVCADYAADTGDTELAESICADVLAPVYKGLTDRSRKEGNRCPEDDELFFARLGVSGLPGAFDILFYKVRTERAFKLVYDRAEILLNGTWGDRHLVPKEWRGFDSYYPANAELERADGLFYGVTHFDELHPKGKDMAE